VCDGLYISNPLRSYLFDMSLVTKAERASLARKTVNQTIPAVLQACSRARAGVQAVQLLRDEDLKPVIHRSDATASPIIRVLAADTLQAAYDIFRITKATEKVCVLSMASELRPGGGFLSGANSQEESLCMRTTLYPSLHERFYRLPKLGCVFTPDVCVYRGRYDTQLLSESQPMATAPTATELSPISQWWFVDVISCAAVRGPEIDENGRYAEPAQRDLMREKIKRLLRAAVIKGCRRLVLGAFGCGAFGNPPGEVAELFKRALMGKHGIGVGKRGGEFAGFFDEVVFAGQKGDARTLPAHFRGIMIAGTAPEEVVFVVSQHCSSSGHIELESHQQHLLSALISAFVQDVHVWRVGEDVIVVSRVYELDSFLLACSFTSRDQGISGVVKQDDDGVASNFNYAGEIANIIMEM
jgi:uncharacterized protein (TIGR02452 family)